MPRECIGYIKMKDGTAIIGHFQLEKRAIFGFSEMKKWLKEEYPDATEISVSKVSKEMSKAIKLMKETNV